MEDKDIQALEDKKKKYEEALNAANQAEGEKKQIQLERQSLEKELAGLGLKSKQELEAEIKKISEELAKTSDKIEGLAGTIQESSELDTEGLI